MITVTTAARNDTGVGDDVPDVFVAAQQAACDQLAEVIGRAAACRATGVARSTYYHHHRVSPAPPRPAPKPHVERVQPRALSPDERAQVRELLNSETYVDEAPATVYAKLLDATGPNQVWTWDITKLVGPARGVWFCLYVLIDIFSRYTPGWMVAATEDAELAHRFLHTSIGNHDIDPDTLTVHADRGAAMKSKSVAELLSDLQVSRPHSRPKTSNDNPYSEAQFKTLKYRPAFPDRFDSIEHARGFCDEFFTWYNR